MKKNLTFATLKNVCGRHTKCITPPAPAGQDTNDVDKMSNQLKNVEPLKDFDWEHLGKYDVDYTPEEKKKLEQEFNKTLKTYEEKSVVEGIVVAKTPKEIVVNINYKSEGVIPANEFRYNPDLKVGDKVEVLIDALEDSNGQLVLSHRKARAMKAWERVNEAHNNDETIKGYVKCRTKGGLIVDVFGIEAFLPGSQIDVKPIKDYDIFVGKIMDFKVVKINPEFKNVVVSHKAIIEAELEEQKRQIISQLEKGQVLEGEVKNITSYGVFIDLGGIDGLIHITDLSWGRISHPEEIVHLGQKLNVVILDFDDEKKRIALGLKQLQPHPWDNLDPELKVGDKVKGRVVVVYDYGAFVEIQPGVEGLIHVSEISWSHHLKPAQEFFKVGDEVEAVILSLDRKERKMSLGVKQLKPDPWIDIDIKYPVESRHKGKVTNISEFGVFVELEEGVDGLVHISDLSWNKKIKHPSEVTKVGETMEVVILGIDRENRRLSLGHKQLEQNPWEVFETVFTVGSQHEGTVIEVNKNGMIVALPYGVEGFCPKKYASKQEGGLLKSDEKALFQVIEFNKNAKKITLSHSATYAPATEEKKEKKAKNKSPKIEKTTLGDIADLSKFKNKLENNNSATKE